MRDAVSSEEKLRPLLARRRRGRPVCMHAAKKRCANTLRQGSPLSQHARGQGMGERVHTRIGRCPARCKAHDSVLQVRLLPKARHHGLVQARQLLIPEDGEDLVCLGGVRKHAACSAEGTGNSSRLRNCRLANPTVQPILEECLKLHAEKPPLGENRTPSALRS